MEALRAAVGKRDSEFTGLKGQLLKYLGTAFFLTVFGLLLVAAGNRHQAVAIMTDPLSSLFFACAFTIYPIVTCYMHLAHMTRDYRAGGSFELAGVVLALYGREGAARAEREQAPGVSDGELVAAMRAGGAAAVIARFGRDRTFALCRAVYMGTIVVFVLVFAVMLGIAFF